MGRVLVGRDAECAVLSRALAAAQGRRTPVVLVSGEGGAGKTTLVEHVLARTGMPVLSGRAAEWAGARELAEMEVGPLDAEDVARMLTHLLGAKPGPALAAAVASRAEGIPFAVEELALALRDGGASAAMVPDGIREAVLLRTARLSGEERTLLETAAVAGQEFDIDPVLAGCGRPAWPDGVNCVGLLT